MTILQAGKDLSAELSKIYDAREAVKVADMVMAKITGFTNTERLINKQLLLAAAQQEQLQIFTDQLIQHRPVQYVLHEAWFAGLKLYVDENVLIPRPETEELVEAIVADVGELPQKALSLIDIGTGSGCIAIALKKNIPGSIIYSIDISEPALRVARQNAEVHMLKIDFLQLNFLDESNWSNLNSYDIIVSNPPYIPEHEKIKLDKNVVMHEPHLALFVENTDPFIFYKKIIMFASDHLLPGGKIYVEVHEDYSREVANLFLKERFKTHLKKDLHGRDRMICAFR